MRGQTEREGGREREGVGEREREGETETETESKPLPLDRLRLITVAEALSVVEGGIGSYSGDILVGGEGFQNHSTRNCYEIKRKLWLETRLDCVLHNDTSLPPPPFFFKNHSSFAVSMLTFLAKRSASVLLMMIKN